MARHSNAQVAHIWAHQSEKTATSHNGKFSFHGSHIDSYSTPVANLVEGIDGRLIALVTSKTYSVTTSGKHISPIYRALDYGRSFIRVFTVPFIGCRGGRNHHDSFNMAEVHAGNLQQFRSSYESMVSTLGRKRDFDHVDALGYLNGIANTAADYCEAFGLDVLTFDTDADAKRLADAYAARNTPAALAKREAARIKREAANAAREARQNAARVEAEAKLRAEFYAGNPHVGYGLRDANGGALLRVKGDTLQTSLGAEVPLAHAIKAFRFVKLCRERGETWARNGRTIRVGHFQVDRIEASGDFVAGCHRINWSEVERIAASLDLLNVEASAEAVELSHRAA
jgi:hypothetical protein